jgi:hypothetical protein
MAIVDHLTGDHLGLQPLDHVIEPPFWTGTASVDPARSTLDGREFRADIARPGRDGALARRMQQMFDDVGLVKVEHTGLTDLTDMRAVAKFVVETEMEDEGGSNPRGVRHDAW